MLDATYKTTRYSLPLFFVVVKTNIDYQIVGSCIVQSEEWGDWCYLWGVVRSEVMEPEMERTPPVLWLTIQKTKCQQLDSYSQVVQWVIAWKSGT